MSKPIPNSRVRVTINTGSGSAVYMVRAHVAPNSGAHGQPYDVTIGEVAATDITGVYELATLTADEFRAVLDRAGMSWGEVEDRLIDVYEEDESERERACDCCGEVQHVTYYADRNIDACDDCAAQFVDVSEQDETALAWFRGVEQ
jgi:hypothetical protein